MSGDNTLSSDQMLSLQKWLTAKLRGKSATCGMCGQNQWSVMDSFVSLPGVGTDGAEIGAGYPHVALSCTNCGNTMLINAIKAGLYR